MVPYTGERVWRSAFGNHAAYGFGNAILMTGEVEKYGSVWRGCVDAVNSNYKTSDDGSTKLYPHVYGCFNHHAADDYAYPGNDPKWDQFSPAPYSDGVDALYYWTQNPADCKWLPDGVAWQGTSPDAAVIQLSDTVGQLRSLVEEMRNDTTTPATRLSDDMNHINPAHCTGALVQCMLGGLPVGRIGHPLHCRLRYFDLQSRRAGLPPGVAALVLAFDANSVTVTLANCSQTEAQTVVLQGGAYGECYQVSYCPFCVILCRLHCAPMLI
eukprot:SAG31_NODE_138_length_22877_cov_29.540917_14_plen_269_part_00